MTSNISTKEFVGMGIALALLAGLGVGAYIYTTQIGNATTREVYEGEIPAKGQWAYVQELETFWKENSKGEIIPVAKITLGPSNDNGTLRVLFRSNIGDAFELSQYIGDSNTLSIDGGNFSNGTKSITIQCTKGLANEAEFLGYKSAPHTRWVVELREAPADTRKASEFRPLTHVAIEPLLEVVSE